MLAMITCAIIISFIPASMRASTERITIGFPLKGMKPLGISAVSDPKRVPFPAAIITAISGFIVDSLYAEVYESLFEGPEEGFDVGVSIAPRAHRRNVSAPSIFPG